MFLLKYFNHQVREVLLIQDVLINIGGEVVREDFLAGANGAAKLTQDDLKYLDDFYNEVTMKRQPESGEPAFAQQLQKAAEHYMGILEGKQREVVGTTYSRLKEIITSVNSCGYFDQVQIQETEVITTEVVSICHDYCYYYLYSFKVYLHMLFL